MTKTTYLEAINACLTALGYQPISTWPSTAADAVVVDSLITQSSRYTQSRGWSWNSYVETWTPSGGTITVPANVIKVESHPEPPSSYQELDLIDQNGTLYDRGNNTSTFTTTVTVRVVKLLDWDELPEIARLYISRRAARMFAERGLGEPALVQMLRAEEQEAWVSLQTFESDNARHTIFDNYRTGIVAARQSPLDGTAGILR